MARSRKKAIKARCSFAPAPVYGKTGSGQLHAQVHGSGRTARPVPSGVGHLQAAGFVAMLHHHHVVVGRAAGGTRQRGVGQVAEVVVKGVFSALVKRS